MRKPKITPELKDAVARLIVAQAYTQAIRPTVEGIQRATLEAGDFQYRIDKPTRTQRGRITDIKDTWLMDDAQANEYYGILHQKYTDAGFSLPEVGYCPLLTAEHDEIKARWAICDAAQYIAGATRNQITAANKLVEYTNLVVGLVLSLEK